MAEYANLRVEHADLLPDEAAGRLIAAPLTRERPGARVGPFGFQLRSLRMEFFTISMLNGLSYGLLLFMLSSGLTLIFSMMGVLNFAHASFYMLGAYVAYSIAKVTGFWPALVIAPLVVGVLGALFERLCLRRVHKFGHVPELLITFGLSFVILELVQLIWGRTAVEFPPPEVAARAGVHAHQLVGHGPAARRRRRAGGDVPAADAAVRVVCSPFPATRGFMMLVALAMLVALWLLLTRTRIGLVIQSALTHPGDGRVARPQRAARVHAGVRRRRRAGRAGRRDRRHDLRHRAGDGG